MSGLDRSRGPRLPNKVNYLPVLYSSANLMRLLPFVPAGIASKVIDSSRYSVT